MFHRVYSWYFNRTGIMTTAERLLGQSRDNISNLAKDIIFDQLRLVVATMEIEEISNRDLFLAAVSSNVEAELKIEKSTLT
jgi:flotillin